MCGTDDAAASWNTSAVPLNYSVHAAPLAGRLDAVACHTGSASCRLRALRCGQTYNVSVKASSGSCSGPYSLPQTVQTAPCPPGSLTAVSDCGTSSLRASWNASVGATTYTTTVTGPGGFSETYSTSNLTRSVSGLRCGSQYNVTVTSQGSCTSSPSQTVLTTGPCDPVNVTSVLQCGSDAATVSWDAVARAVHYTVHARQDSSQHSTSCRSSTTSCQLNQLQCGKVYNLTVMAEDATCNSTGRISTLLMTAPCSPSIHNSSLVCGTNSSSLSWMPMACATAYTVNATATNGHTASCSSATASCTLTDLLCSETYTTTIIARGSRCDSAPGSGANITTAPCSPAILSKQYTCGNNTAVFSWTDPVGRVDFLAQVSREGYQDTCQTTNTDCAFHNLACGLDFNLTVQAQGAQCDSIPSVSESMETVPCAPQNVSATLVCLDRSALVSWAGSPSAVGYNVTVTGRAAHTHHGHSNTTSSQLPGIHCGDTYGITVTPYSETCTGHTSAVYSFEAGLCAPSNVSVSAACEDSAVSWSRVAGAEIYIAIATANDGHNQTCSSNYSSSCNFTDLHCGETYAVTVVTVDRGCWSEPSSAAQLRTGLCPPTNLTGQVSCDTNTLALTWDQNLVSGATYTLQTEKIGGTLPLSMHTTSNTSHTLTNLLCGQRYAFRIAALDGDCNSSYSPPIGMSTAPCKPTNFTGHVDCGTNKGHFSWSESRGAGFYTVEVTGEHGHVASCSSSDASCAVKLHCGRSYSASLVASTESCNSSKHADLNFDSAPCLPEDVLAELQCDSNVMNVSWTQTPGQDEYTAWAISPGGHRASCNSSFNSCSIHELRCGGVYEVAVTSSSIHCTIIAGSDYTVQSAPCKPENTTVERNCSSNAVTVRWNQSSTTQNYTVQATCASGVNSTCDSPESSCSFLDLSCGQLCTFTVTGHTNVCVSETSTPQEKLTAPCPPTNVSAELNCTTGTALVRWQSSAAAAAYSVEATSTNGNTSSCSEAGTSCHLNNLVCGQDYSVVVEAMHTGCPGPSSLPARLTTEPCVPADLSVHYNMSTAQVTWGPARGASSYSVQAVTDQGLTVSCNTTNSSCHLNGLQCSHVYNVTVMARNPACDGVIAETHRLTTEPCPPTNVQASIACEQLNATVSWQQSDLAVGYVAYFDNQNGHDTSCVGSDAHPQCVVSGLMCGTVYNVCVKALGRQYNSSDSTVTTLTSEPCQPVIVSAQALCQSEVVHISWHQASGVVNYIVTASGSLGYLEVHNTSQTLLTAALPCGQHYNVTVQGRGSECLGSPSSPASFRTTPCVPRDVRTSVQCEVSVGSVSWAPSDGAETYSVVATGLDGHTQQCLTNTTSCTWTDLRCGDEYAVVLRAQEGNCTSLPSNSSVIHMGSCVPQNVSATVACDLKVVSLSWDASNGTQMYVVSGEAGNQTVGLTTNVTTAHFSDFDCGQNYSLTVTPHNELCPGNSSAAATIETWPCPPAGISTMQDCLSGIVMVTWQASNGSAYYTATMQTDTGISKMCMSDSNECNVPSLTCGHNFSVSVTASSERCDIVSRQTARLQSVPCAPTNVSVGMDWTNNTARVSWSASRGAEQYSVTAHSSHSNVSCHTSDHSCSLDIITCGHRSTVQVVAMNDNCSSIPSQALILTSAPCPPQNVSSEVSCWSNDMTVSWDANSDADHFMVSVTSADGGSSESCNATSTACSISNVTCGNTFRVQVASVRGARRSQLSPALSILSAPCQPQGIRGNLDCVTNSAEISWDAAPGADRYAVSAVGGGGETANCTASSNTTCEVADLACGVLYNFSVTAKNSKCESQPSATFSLQTALCSLAGITAVPQCHNSSILVLWDLMEGGEGSTVYTATAEAADRTYLSCNNTDTGCYLHGARCDLHYTVVVAASSDQCSSLRSPPSRISMEPCPPRNVVVNATCEDTSALVSWSPSPVAETYHVVAVGVDGHVYTCNSTSCNCSMSELLCDQQYTVGVTARHDNCSSKASQNVTFNTGPCRPTGLSVTLHCNNRSASLSWTPSDNAADYSGCAQAGSGDVRCCSSTDPTCTIAALDCGTVYNFSVQASDGTCNSSFSDSVQRGAAPCPPDSVEVQLIPMQMEIQVMHFTWTRITCSDTEYKLQLTGSLLGDSQAQFQLSSYWTSVTYFEIPLPCGSSYSATVESRSAAGTSDPSAPLNQTTAPCPPSGVEYSGNGSFATVAWNASVFASTYTVYDPSATPPAQLCSTAGLSCSLSNVASPSLLITASNTAGESETTSVPQVVTQGRRRRDLSGQKHGGLSAPVLNVTQAMPTVIFIEWSPIAAASHYSLVIKEQSSSREPQTITVQGESIILTDLRLHAAYCFSVSAEAEAASGPESEPVCVQTGPRPRQDDTTRGRRSSAY
ncbi:fibronectin-like [Pseudoliparis swirei]|uniref:fibronectin-like n=1 Tax=Pseudoliparis swirei TaxID=2059687 RepID=UPI0024BDD8F2|nr:fibronectin-like [Pseudoliparis swirei]